MTEKEWNLANKRFQANLVGNPVMEINENRLPNKAFMLITLLSLAIETHAATWQSTQWNSGVSVKQTATGFTFNIPSGNGHVNSVERKQGAIPFKATVTFSCKVVTLSGSPKFVSLDTAPSPPALKPNCRLMIQRKGDDWTCNNSTQNYRWWSTGALCVFLNSDGKTYTYSVKLIPANWTNCWGKSATAYPNEFKQALANTDNVEIVFGGGNSFSHGLRIKNGNARYELLAYSVK